MADFDWRISVAEVREPSPFSSLPGVDRLLLLVEGDAMELVVDGVAAPASQDRALAFRGESEVVCSSLPSGSTVDLNVMTRRGRFTASLEVVSAEGARVVGAAAVATLVVALGPAVEVNGTVLDTLDVAVLDAPATLSGGGRVALVTID